MRSPFPGMDPYLEHAALWPDVHAGLVHAIREELGGRVGERYWVGLERRVYIEYEGPAERGILVPDVTVAGSDAAKSGGSGRASPAPIVLEVPDLLPVEVREVYLVVRELPSMKVVTVIEVLSPSNKREGVGRQEYLAKRGEVLRTRTHLVEIDLLRAGERPPVRGDLPACDYLSLVHRAESRPRAEAYPWRLRDPIPPFPLPLLPGDSDIALSVGEALVVAYERGRYHRVIDYSLSLDPPLPAEDAAWAAERFAGNR
ncbi:MAG: DUF4058 family protein [Planctomycetes bacterium]|nr:DUF4058 family protein [Planctomycetota bacterium]